MPKVSTNKPVQLSVIVPAYNEGFHIHDNLLSICSSLRHIKMELIVVDDGSTDNTFKEIKRAVKSQKQIKAFRLSKNAGKGASLLYGFSQATGDMVAFFDSDLEIAPEYILKLIKVMQKQKVDVVTGVKDPTANHFPAPRRLVSSIYKNTVRFLFGLSITDTQTGIKLFKREVLEKSIPRMNVSRFAFDLELLVATSRYGYRIIEMPVEVKYVRKGGMGRMKLGVLFATFFDTLGIYFRASFWRWLEPSASTHFWMVAFVLGVFLAGIGFAKVLSPIILKPELDRVSYIVFLRFIPAAVRDPMLAVTGLLVVLVSLIQLNKILLNAFARKDRGDLAGILRK